jgi:hypothetical protein
MALEEIVRATFVVVILLSYQPTLDDQAHCWRCTPTIREARRFGRTSAAVPAVSAVAA